MFLRGISNPVYPYVNTCNPEQVLKRPSGRSKDVRRRSFECLQRSLPNDEEGRRGSWSLLRRRGEEGAQGVFKGAFRGGEVKKSEGIA